MNVAQPTTQLAEEKLWQLLTCRVGMDPETADMYMDDLTTDGGRYALNPGDGTTLLVFCAEDGLFQEELSDVVLLVGGWLPVYRAESERFGAVYLAGSQVASVFVTQSQAQRHADSLLDALYDAFPM
jgi:hypothetical protein